MLWPETTRAAAARWTCCVLGSAALVFSLCLPVGAAGPDAAGLDYFEKHIRPALVENCYQCHSPAAEKGIKGGLRLDTREGWMKGGDTGPAIVPGQPDKSLLIRAIRYADEQLQMPPKGKRLPPETVAHFEAWVSMGAPDPRTEEASGLKPKAKSSEHWAFRPVEAPSVPAVKNRKQVQTPVDNFLLARLEKKKLKLSPPADRRTLLRRACFDLTGLPPTAEDVQRFEADSAPGAFARVVDRLLASPQYGERWGRYWLDVARYADTKGYVFEEERRYPYSYTYRDWVIRAFNEDLSYDQFLVQQLAADQLALGDDKRSLAALGFLTLGRRFLNNQPDIIDDRIDVVSRGTMALTVGCARCHDHKFDPIPMKDYYSLYGVFASTHEPRDLPLLGDAAKPKDYDAYVAERTQREQELTDYRKRKEEEVRQRLRGEIGDYLLVLHDAAGAPDEKREQLVRERKLEPVAVRHFQRARRDWSRARHAAFVPWFELEAAAPTNFAARVAALVTPWATADGTASSPSVPAGLFDPARPPASLKEVARAYNKLFAGVDAEWRALQTKQPATTALPDAGREALRQVLYGNNSPILALDRDELHRLMETPTQQKLRALKRKVDELDATHPGAPPRAMALLDNSQPTTPRVFRRGNPGNPGEEVPRQFLEMLAGPGRRPFTQGSGRLEMARAIASRGNPLTARVWVNRVWMYHFGVPLVSTPSDFGVRSDPPTHPELLDFLAARFMDEGWSVKKLHRQIMLSAAYQQSSGENSKAAEVDPANELLWRMNRHRLDFESMRDTFLAVSGQIDLTAGGHAVDIVGEPISTRRTVYGFVERQNLPGLFRTFDFASPDTTSPQRFATTVPQQALFLMNSPFVVQQAEALLQRAEIKAARSDPEKVRQLYRIVYQRAPAAAEVKLANAFLASQAALAAPAESPAWQYGFGRVEETNAAPHVAEFAPLSHFTGYAWQGGTNLPDARLGWVLLTADGGHVGNDLNHAAIRRWTAPRDGSLYIRGELNHPSDRGDGVRARVISSRLGELGSWTAAHGRTVTVLRRVKVKEGDHLDFVTDCRTSVAFDSFHWAPVIHYGGGAARATNGVRTEWNAKTDFTGPPKPRSTPLSPWVKYAQVLLLSNELMFVD